MQEYIKPMLPAELSRPFDNEDWLFEKNLGGFRAITVKSNGNINMYANKNQLYNNDFPQLVKDLEKHSSNFILDGEIVMLNEEGNPDLDKLLNFRNNSHLPVRYYVFDILSAENQSLLKTPLIKRKEILKKLLPVSSRYIFLKNFIFENGCDLYRSATKDNLEGITAKNLNGLYHPGRVSSEWLKIRIRKSQEVYICGFTKPSVNNKHIGSIIAGYKDNNAFCYSGHIAAGSDKLDVQELYTQLIPLVTEKSPFHTEIKSKTDIVWVKPVLKCEVKYLDLAKDHLMRQPVLVSVKNE